jgi:hypothetical protein
MKCPPFRVYVAATLLISSADAPTFAGVNGGFTIRQAW